MNKKNSHKEPGIILPRDTTELLGVCQRYMEKGFYHHSLALLYYADLLVRRDGGDRGKILLMLARCTLELSKFAESERFIMEGRELADRVFDKDQSIAFSLIETRLKLATNSLDEADSLLVWAQSLLGTWYNKELEIECFILRSRISQQSGYAEAALEAAHRALKEISAEHNALLGVEAYHALALAMAENGDGENALKYFNIAIENCNIEGNQFYEAALYLAAGNFVGRELGRVGSSLVRDQSRPPAWYFARALTLYHQCGTVRDLERTNQGFKKFGRRESDQLGNREINEHSSRLSYFLGRLAKNLDEDLKKLMEIHLGAPENHWVDVEQSVEHVIGNFLTTHHTLMDLEKKRRELVESANQMGVERKKLERLVEYGRKLSSILEEDLLMGTTLGIIMEVVESDGVAFLPNAPESQIRGSIIRGTPLDTWHRIALMVLNSDEAVVPDFFPFKTRKAVQVSSSSDPHVTALPVRAGNACYGVIYCDKRKSGSKLSPMDITMIESLILQVGTLLDNYRMQRISRVTAINMEATLDAISDGVITLNRHRQVMSINRAAIALFDMPKNKILGVPFDTLPINLPSDLKRLRTETLLRFPRGEVLTISRPLTDHLGETAGEVITMTELRKVKKAVHSIAVPAPRYTFEHLTGNDPAFMAQVKLARIAAQAESDILITGESGTGKEVFAQAVHNAGNRSEGPFIAINCAAIPGELLESELFGYEEGSFTGAVRGGKPGKFELAEGGTLLLDEIGDMPLEMQAKLLRVLQERQYRRIGGTLEYLFDVRIISTTNRPLERLVEINQFRSDLLYRLRVMHLHIPPLRDRAADIPRLAQVFLERFAGKMGKKVERFGPKVLERMMTYQWPGNIRELEHIVEAEVNVVPQGVKLIDSIPAVLIEQPVSKPLATPQGFNLPPEGTSLDEMERTWLLGSLRRNGYSATRTARDLGVSRGTIYNKIKRFGIDVQGLKWEDTHAK
ncbi:sigma 54-interacting transcriptional regulator [Myxococcota bacterium]|nr:sigma 54-interacting transcriptional regulator [Myxococcota bacterium]MBU1535691.1 sigma 54-interacting transcriptional regulator [Myxococcota bacterium]